MSTDNTNTHTAVIKSDLFGRVKWFNHRLGYGFITNISKSSKEEQSEGLVVDEIQDVFVHHNAIRSEDDTYKYLVQGEYVQFHLVDTQNSTYKVQADLVRGIFDGPLMCDVHNEQKKHSSALSSSSTHHNNNNRQYNRRPSSSYNNHRDEQYTYGGGEGSVDRERHPDREREHDDSYGTRRPYVSSSSYSGVGGGNKRNYSEHGSRTDNTPRSVRRSY